MDKVIQKSSLGDAPSSVNLCFTQLYHPGTLSYRFPKVVVKVFVSTTVVPNMARPTPAEATTAAIPITIRKFGLLFILSIIMWLNYLP